MPKPVGLVIRTVHFGDGVVEMQYMTLPTDIRAKATLAQSHIITIDVNKGDYDDEVEALEHAARALLVDALEDWQMNPPALEDPDDA